MHACTAPAAPFSSWPHPPPPLPRGLGCVGVSASSRSPIHFSFGTSSSTRRRPEPIPHTKGGDAFLSGHPRAPTASNHLLILAQQVADRMVEDKGTGRHAACHCAHTVGTWTWTVWWCWSYDAEIPHAPAVARLCMEIRETRWTHAVFGGVRCGTSLKG